MTAGLRFLLVDDHALVRAGIRQILSSHFCAVFLEAENAREALEEARGQKLDLILLDVTMPGRSGLDVLGDLKTAQPKACILVLSMYSEAQFALRALRTGASGYVTKTAMPDELVKAVQKVLAGGIYLSESLAQCLALAFQAGETQVNLHEGLSAREFEVLRMIVTGKSGKEIAADLSLSFKTVSTYRTRILQKLKLRNNADLVKYSLREGLVE